MHRTRLGFVLAVVALIGASALGCRRNADPDAGVDAGTDDGGMDADAGSDAGTDGGMDVDAGEGLPASVRSFALAFTRVSGLGAGLAGPLVSEGDATFRDRTTRTEGGARTSFESAFSGMSVVTPSTCATFMWERLLATITLTGCTLEALGGIELDGTVTTAISINPTSFTVGVIDATVVWGDATITGGASLTLEVAGTDTDPTRTIGATAFLTTPEGTVSFTVTGLTIANDGTTITLDGSGNLMTSEVDADFTMSSVGWTMGSCLPTGGSVTYDDGVSTTVTFLPTTPTTGEVTVMRGALPAVTVALLPPCP
jgi:hypothetical protein